MPRSLRGCCRAARCSRRCVWAFALTTPAAASDVILYRVFLLDGTTAVSYGEFARTARTVVFSMPLGGLDDRRRRSCSWSACRNRSVDWPRTEAYAEAARARRFVDTRGEAEFSRLSDAVAGTLNQIAFTEDPARRLAMADRARRMLADWPARNYGYRAADVAQLAALLDEVVSELRVAAGQSRFDLSLVASPAPPPSVPLLPPPTLRDSVEQAFVLARVLAGRGAAPSLLRGITDALAGAGARGRLGGGAAGARERRAGDLDAHRSAPTPTSSAPHAARRPTSGSAAATSRASSA